MIRRTFLTSLTAGLAWTGRAGALTYQRERPIQGQAGPGLERFDEIMLELMRQHEAPGASLSLAKEGRLVYARGFGWASVEPRRPVGPETRFGLASVSKAITGVGILRLVDQGRLGLDDPAFERLADLRPMPGERIDPRTRTITIRQLLNHSAGYEGQPNVQEVARRFNLPVAKLREDHLVAFFLGRPLDYDPGTEQHYSNYGFVVLGAILERLVGLAYGPAVHRLVFEPMGVRGPRLGHGGAYGPDTAHRYGEKGNELPPIDLPGGAAGGWIASSVEMVRFLAALDGARPFLSEAVQREMLAPPPPPLKQRPNGAWFGLGWDVVHQTPHGPSYAKDGGIAGVRSYIGHMPGNVDWAVVFNGGRNVPGQPGQDANAAKHLQEGIRQTQRWPETDFFPNFPDVGPRWPRAGAS